MKAEYSMEEVLAEVERLPVGQTRRRAMLTTPAERINADESAADDKEKALADWGKSLNRRVEIETELFDCASGKRPLPTAEDCRRMALRLGTPDRHPPAQAAQHPDDAAVDAFAEAMKAKLAEARAKGRGGWRDKADCPQQRLSDMLRAHVAKGDPRDVANFCLFLHQRGEAILPAEPAQAAQADEAAALAHFTDYFVRNYPGPNTIIYDPKWHAPKIFRAAQYAIANATTAPAAEPVAQGEADLCDCDADKYNKLPHHADCAVLAAQPRAVPDGWETFIRDCAANSHGVWVTEARVGRASALLAANHSPAAVPTGWWMLRDESGDIYVEEECVWSDETQARDAATAISDKENSYSPFEVLAAAPSPGEIEGERPRLNKTEMREYVRDLFAANAARLTQPAQSVDVEKVREVIASIDLRAETYLDPQCKGWADKLTVALQEKSNG